jgi:hypothetical protein
MSRLFVTNREIALINDLTKELVKDIVGQKIFYFPISEIKTRVHDVYNESPEKVFDNPIEIDALVDQQEWTPKIDQFGYDLDVKLKVYIQRKDLIDKNIQPSQGDFFTYGDVIYEVTQLNFMKNIYGQIEHYDGVQLTATNSRISQANVKFFGPTEVGYTDEDAALKEFYQQRGEEYLKNGIKSEDIRELQKNGVLEKPITGAKEISQKGILSGSSAGSSFYGDDQ